MKIPVPIMGVIARILIFAALVAGTAIVVRPLQLTLQHRMEKIRDNFIGRAEEFYGRKIQYGSMGPSIFGELDIRNIQILRNDNSVLLNISRLRLSYSFWEFFKGNIFDAFNSAKIDRPVLSLDFEKDADLRERFFAGGGAVRNGSPDLRKLLPGEFFLRIRNGEWGVSGSIGSLKLQGVGIDASVHKNRVRFEGRWTAAASLAGLNDSGALPAFLDLSSLPALGASMIGRVSGEFADDLKDGSAAIAIPSISADYFKFRPMTVNFLLSEELLQMTYNNPHAGLSLVYDLDAGRFRGRFNAENFTPADVLAFSGSWVEYNRALSFMISGDAGLTREASGALDYTINLSGAMPDDTDSVPAPLEIQVQGSDKLVSVENLDIDSPFGKLAFRGSVDLTSIAPNGYLSLSGFSLRKTGGISGEFYISTQDRKTSVFVENLTAGTVTLSALDASLYREEQGLVFNASALRFRNIESYEDVRMGTLSVECFVDFEPDNMRLSLMLDSFSIGDLLALAEPLAPVPDMPPFVRSAADDLLVTTEFFFTTDYKQVLYNAPRVVAAYEGVRDILAAASISGTGTRFEISNVNISWGGGSAELAGSVEFSNPDDISFSISAAHRDLNYLFEGMIMEKRNINIMGSYGFQIFLSVDPNGTYTGFVQGNNLPFPSGENPALLSISASLVYYSRSSWRVVLEKFEISGMTTPASTSAVVKFTGSANEKGITVPDFFFNDGKGALDGDMNLAWEPGSQNYSFKADILGNARDEYYGISGTYRDKQLELNLSGRGMQLSRISAKNAVAEGSARLLWNSIHSFEAETTLSSLVLYERDREIRISAEAGLNDKNLYVRQLKIDFSGLAMSVPFLWLSRADSRAEADAFIQGNFGGIPVDLAFKGKASFNAVETWFDMFRDFSSLDGLVTVDTARYSSIQASEPFSFTISGIREKEGLTLNINGGPRNMVRFRYAPDEGGNGNFYAAFSAPSPVRGSVSGSIGLNTIDASTTDLYVDLGSLWKFMPPEADSIMFPGGIVNASIRVTGSLDDPEFYGTALATSVQIRIPEFLPEPIRPVPTTFTLSGSEMTFGPSDAFVGKGRGKGSGWFRFEQWIPSTLIVDVEVPNETPIPYGFDVSGVIANGLASGRLIVSMQDWVLSVNGDLTAHNTEISLNAKELAIFEGGFTGELKRKPNAIPVLTDFSIRTGRRVEFFWPSVAFPILQANADMGTGINFTSDSESNRFTLTGDVKLRSGEIFYLERNFYLREGTLFLKENETQFDPRITARAEIRDQANSGPVTISMIIDNAPLMSFSPIIEIGESVSKPSARFEANPPLSQLEIYSLLGQNPQGETETQRNVAASAVLDSLAQFTIIRRVQRQVRDFLRLDMFSMRTQVIQNMVLQATGTQPEDMVDRPYRVGNYFDNSTVFLGKYFNANLFGEAMLSFRYDENKQSMGGIKLEPEIGLEMRNPLFDIRFNMLPLHPENWFINDISFSLIWRRTF